MRKLALLIIFVLFFCSGSKAFAGEEGTQQLIIINKANNKLAFFDHGKLISLHDVATGLKPAFTPEGTFHIIRKVVDPSWKNVPGGIPQNPLGHRWMGLDALGTKGNIYGIHGTNNESSIGKRISNGCVRMHNKEVEALFDKVKLNTPVYITTSNQSFEQLAASIGYTTASKPEKTDVIITISADVRLYDKPFMTGKTAALLSPQTVESSEKVGDWYKVNTWVGEKWIFADPKQTSIQRNVRTINKDIDLDTNTPVFAEPGNNTKALGALSPQTVHATGEWNGWYKIESWLGEVWIKDDGKQ
jgi:hypothetical protein